MALDLRLVLKAQALAEHGSFSRAADALGITQPALSRSIKELEDDVGLPLFVRRRHGTELTDFGNVFLERAAVVVAQVAELERDVAKVKGLEGGELAVGFGPYAAEVLAPACMAHFAANHPRIRLRIHIDTLEALGRALRLRALDLVIGEASTLENDNAFEILERLPPIPGHLIGRAGHPLTKRSTVTLQDALDFPLIQIGRLPIRVLAPIISGRRPQTHPKERASIPIPAMECPSVSLAVRAAKASDALMFATLSMVRGELAGKDLVPLLHLPWMQTDWAVIRGTKRMLGHAAGALLNQVRTTLAAVLLEEESLQRRWQRSARREPAGISAKRRA